MTGYFRVPAEEHQKHMHGKNGGYEGMNRVLNNLDAEKLAQYFDHTQLRAFAVTEDFEKLCEESRRDRLRN